MAIYFVTDTKCRDFRYAYLLHLGRQAIYIEYAVYVIPEIADRKYLLHFIQDIVGH